MPDELAKLLAVQAGALREKAMLKFLAPLTALALSSPLMAQEAAPPPTLNLEQETALRCGMAFAIAARSQHEGVAEFAKYPPLQERGREFFVRTTAQLMDETGASRETIGAMVMERIKQHQANPAAVHEIMPACLLMLDASGI
jgi:hypothetical protein